MFDFQTPKYALENLLRAIIASKYNISLALENLYFIVSKKASLHKLQQN